MDPCVAVQEKRPLTQPSAMAQVKPFHPSKNLPCLPCTLFPSMPDSKEFHGCGT
jgi:hypothetical protein